MASADGRVALITGAAALDGIGAACARALAAAGHPVGLLDRTACDALRDEIVSAGGRAIALTVDLREAAAVSKVVVRDAQAIRRTLVPGDYGGLLAFLVSDQAGVITGQTISADAGLVLR